MRKSIFAEKYITFDLYEKYESEADLFNDVMKVMQILIRNGYECAFRYDDCGIYVLEFGSRIEGTQVYWLDEEQKEFLFDCINEHYEGEDNA